MYLYFRKTTQGEEVMARILTESYPHTQKIYSSYENTIRFDGGHQISEGLYAQKLAFDTELRTTLLSTPVTNIQFVGEQESLAFDGKPTSPRAYRLGILPRKAAGTPQEILRSQDGAVSVKTFFVSEGTFGGFGDTNLLNADGDEVWFVYKGSGTCSTSFGELEFQSGDYIFIPRLTTYCFLVKNGADAFFVGIESYESLRRPSFPQRDTPYNLSAITLPEPNPHPEFWEGCSYKATLKRGGVYTEITYKYQCLSCVGYNGSLYPFVLSTKDVTPAIIPSAHTDPNMFATFITESNDVAISTFTPRWVHSLPYNHMNYWDECLFLAKEYAARAWHIQEGDMTFHPQGFAHGPHRDAFAEWEKNKPEHIKDSLWKDDLAIMFESRKPLFPTGVATQCEIQEYCYSWNNM